MKNLSLTRGYFMIQTLVFGAIAVIVIGALVSFANTSLRAGNISILKEQAFQIAEAGVEYYRWHLAHDPEDFTDGTGEEGPYVHEFRDKDGVVIGSFSLDITAPPVGSTLVTVESTGTTLVDPSISRTIRAELAIPSFAKFAVVTASDMRFGPGTEIFGTVHSNGGIRVDGLAHNLITSSVSDYNDPDHGGGNEFGVHTHVDQGQGVNNSYRPFESPPNPVQSREDVFTVGRSFPVPAVDFSGLIADLAEIKTEAQDRGVYLPSSGAQGYLMQFRTNNSVDVYRVNSLVTPPVNQCNNFQDQNDWGTWSVNSTTFLLNYDIPDNGIIFVEDDIWVEGQIDESRVTVGSARFPDNASNRTTININNDLLYTNYDGRDSIGLISQSNINVGMVSRDVLRIDAALVAQNGRIGRYFYRSFCSPYDDRSTITLYGMIASTQRYGFAYTDGSGYEIRNIIYDSNLLYAPPPSFPLTSDHYQVISWREVVN